MDPSAFVQLLEPCDFISNLPPELSKKILSKLDALSLLRAAQVSKAWNRATENEELWKVACVRLGWELNEVKRKAKSYKAFCKTRELGWLFKPVKVIWGAQEDGNAREEMLERLQVLCNTAQVYGCPIAQVTEISQWDWEIELPGSALVLFIFGHEDTFDGVPERARPFIEALSSAPIGKGNMLRGVKFSTFIHGDSRYDIFNRLVDLKVLLERHGARCVLDPGQIDESNPRANVNHVFSRWITRVWLQLEYRRGVHSQTVGSRRLVIRPHDVALPSQLPSARFEKAVQRALEAESNTGAAPPTPSLDLTTTISWIYGGAFVVLVIAAITLRCLDYDFKSISFV
eukprot:Colp12_sorted_trinity150504_noHs@25605